MKNRDYAVLNVVKGMRPVNGAMSVFVGNHIAYKKNAYATIATKIVHFGVRDAGKLIMKIISDALKVAMSVGIVLKNIAGYAINAEIHSGLIIFMK